MNVALIMAAGSGQRMNSETPKQFIEVNGHPILWWTVKAFNDSTDIDAIFIVTNSSYFNKVDEVTLDFEKVIGNIQGGSTRQESVFNGINYLLKNGFINDDIVLIHDAARPLVTTDIIKNNVEGCKIHGAVDTVIPANDSIIRSLDASTISQSENRKELFQNQTPQTFKLGIIKEAYDKLSNELDKYTDDCQIVIKSGYKIHLVEGSKLNFKVTTKEDLELLEAILSKK